MWQGMQVSPVLLLLAADAGVLTGEEEHAPPLDPCRRGSTRAGLWGGTVHPNSSTEVSRDAGVPSGWVHGLVLWVRDDMAHSAWGPSQRRGLPVRVAGVRAFQVFAFSRYSCFLR